MYKAESATSHVPAKVKTIIFDNVHRFSNHGDLARGLRVRVEFFHSYFSQKEVSMNI